MKRLMLVLLMCGSCWAANVFSGDPNCIAVYRFENGALTTDSQGTNTLTTVGTPDSNTADYREGAGCVDLEYSSTEYYTIADASLDAGFPMKNGTDSNSFSVTLWFKTEAWTNSVYNTYFRKKYNTLSHYNGSHSMSLWLEGTGGPTSKAHLCGGSLLDVDNWYFLAATFDNSTLAVRIHIWDSTTAADVGSDIDENVGGTFGSLVFDDSLTYVAGANFSSWKPFDGLIDELTVWNRAITRDEIDLIRQGLFPGTTSAVPNWWWRRRHD